MFRSDRCVSCLLLFSSLAVVILFLPDPLLALFAEGPGREPKGAPPSSLSENIIPAKRPPRTPSGEAETAPQEVLVKFRKGLKAQSEISIHAEVGAEVLSRIDEIHVHRVRGSRGQTAAELIQEYRKRPDVEYAERNGRVHVHKTPNDPRFPELWGLNNTGQNSGKVDADIDAPEAWDVATGAATVIVADIDTGVDYTHPDLAANIWTNPGEIPGNGIDDDGNGYIDDVHGWDFANNDNDPMDDAGHGTHTAGTIGAVGNNGVGVAGIAWSARILPIKFMDANGEGTFENAAKAILYGAKMGARISNNSYGGGFSQTIEDAINMANQQGMLVVTSAGNDGVDVDQPSLAQFPCASAAPNVLCVAATDRLDTRIFFSNYGAKSVDLGAPGVSILSTVPTGNCAICSPGGYLALSGTSMASPHVAGAAALVLAHSPSLTSDRLKALLMSSVDLIPDLKDVTATGGRLNVNRAVRSNFIMAVAPAYRSVSAGGSSTYTVTVTSVNGFSGSINLSFVVSDSHITGSLSPSSVSLPPNGSATATLTISTEAGLPTGPNTETVHGTAASGEDHSVSVVLQITTDLAVTLLNGPTSGETGKWITVTDSIENRGTGQAKRFYIGYYLSTDAAISTSDIFLGSRWVNTLDPGATSAATTPITIPIDVPPGSYTLGAVADFTGTVADPDSANNVLAGGAVTITAGTGNPPDWVSRYNGPVGGTDTAGPIVTDAAGNVYVTGRSSRVKGTADYDYATIKYDPAGNQLWAARFPGQTQGMTIDGAGNVYVTGYACVPSGCVDSQYATVKYDPFGNQLWVATYNHGASDVPFGVAVDSSGNVYVTGASCQLTTECPGPTIDFATVKYDPNGRLLWVDRYDNGDMDGARAIALDSEGNVYVTGTSVNGTVFGTATIKYGPLGNRIWVVRSDRESFVAGLAVDPSGNVYLTRGVRESIAGGSYDYETIKYDSNGNQVWVATYDNGGFDLPRGMALDSAGNVYVTGSSENGMSSQSQSDSPIINHDSYATVKYDPQGRLLWAARYDSFKEDVGAAVAVDASGNVYVTGESCRLYDRAFCLVADYVTLKYSAEGLPLWMNRFDHGGDDYAVGLALDRSGNLYVTGTSFDSGSNEDYATMKFAAPLPDLIVTSVSGPANAAAGTGITVTDAVRNQAAHDAGPFGIGFYLSRDRTVTTSDLFIGRRSAGPLAAGASGGGTTTLTLPPDIPSGTYTLGAIADYNGGVAETNDVNNALAGNTITVTGGSGGSFFDDFNRPDSTNLGSNWNEYMPNLEIFSNQLRNVDAGTKAAIWSQSIGVDQDVSVDCYVTATGNSCGVMGRWSNVDNFYRARLDVGAKNITAFKTVNGTTTQLGSASRPIQYSTYYRVRLVIKGSSLQVFFADEPAPAISVTDTSLPAGSLVGLRTFSSGPATTWFDNFSASSGGAPPVNQPPVARLSASPTSGTPPLAVHFDGSTSSDPDGSITAYTWNFGDGATSSGITADHTYSAAGTFTATLTVTDNNGATGTAQAKVTATSSGSSTLFEDQFNRTTGLGPAWKVTAGAFSTDGNYAVSSGAANWAQITENLSTNDYTVESLLIVPAGSLYSGIVARGNPSAFSSDLYSAQIATDGTVNLYRRNAGTWTQLKNANGGIVANQAYTLKLKVAGSNPVNLEVSLNGSLLYSYQDSAANRILSGVPGIENYNSGVKYDRFTVSSGTASANEPPTVLFSAKPATGAAPLAVHFDASGSIPGSARFQSFFWEFGDGATQTSSASSDSPEFYFADHTYSAAGTYTVTLTITDADGAKGSAQTTITATSSGSVVLFDDPFSRTTGLGSNWSVSVGSFTTDGNFAIGQGVQNWAAITPPLKTNDYTVESVLIIPAGSLYSGIVARGKAASDFYSDLYAAQIATQGSVNLYRRNAGTWTLLKSASAAIAAGQPYTLKLKVAGSNPVNLEVSLNGSLLMTYADSAASRILSGIPGIQNYNTGVKYDRFTVTGP